MVFQTHIFPNGIRVIHKHEPSLIAHCGIIINTGSRDETPMEHGLAHFLEHMIFKGTRKRKAFHIANRLENVGGDLNAYTTKEYTCIHASFLKEDYERSLELLNDIVFNSIFPEKELKKEREVILDEINSFKDSPSDLIFDDFEEIVFENQPIGRNILGDKKHLLRFTKQSFDTFILNNYHTDQMVISSLGDIPFDKLLKICSKYFGQVPENRREHQRILQPIYNPRHVEKHKKTYQAHYISGIHAYNFSHPKKNGLQLLTNILGGPCLNSRLNMSIREKHGLAYNAEANYTPYTDTGLFLIYIATDKKNLDRCKQLMNTEINRLKNERLSPNQLKTAKKQILGQIAISSENKESFMISMGKTFLFYNKTFSLEEIRERFENINSEELQDIANEILCPDNFTSLTYL